jgi:hypothetical protein
VKKTLIVKKGRLVEMPEGIMMFAPTKLVPMATTTLYSWPAKLRMALDLVIPRRRFDEGIRADESLESFVVRRMGRECLDRLAEPLIGGVNGSDPKTMSLAATYPMLLAMEQEHGSLIRGFLAQRKKVEEMKRKYPAKAGAKRRTFFTSFEKGLQSLTDRMAEAAGLDRIRTGSGARDRACRWSVDRHTRHGRAARGRRGDRGHGDVGRREVVQWCRRADIRSSRPDPLLVFGNRCDGFRHRGLPIRPVVARHTLAPDRASARHGHLSHVLEMARPRSGRSSLAEGVCGRAARSRDSREER